MSVCAKLITKIDIFGQGIQLKINNDTKSKTCFGGILTIIMLISAVTLFGISVEDVIYKLNPQTSQEEQVSPRVPTVLLNHSNMAIAMVMMVDGIIANKEDYFNMKILYTSRDASKNQYITEELPSVNCEKTMFEQVDDVQYEGLNLDQAKCIKDQNFTLSGSWTENYLYYLSIRFEICSDSDGSSTNCAPKEEIWKFIKINQVSFNLYVLDTILNPQNYSEPLSYTLAAPFTFVKSGASKLKKIYISNQTLLTDDGLILPAESSKTGLTIEKTDNDDFDFDEDNGILIEYTIYSSDVKFVYYRKYTRIQEVLASVSSLNSIIMMAFSIISSVFSGIQRDLFILNRIVDYDLNGEGTKCTPLKTYNIMNNMQNNCVNDNSFNYSVNNTPTYKKNPQFNKNRNRTSSNSHLNDNLSYSNSPISSRMIIPHNNQELFNSNYSMSPTSPVNPITNPIPNSQFMNQGIDTKQVVEMINTTKEKRELKFSFREILKGFLCCQCCSNSKIKAKKALYLRSKPIVEDYLEITTIISKLEELEKLKMLIFKPDQLCVFSFLSNELVSLDSQKMSSHYMTKCKQLVKDKEHSANCLAGLRNIIQSSGKVREIDKKIYNLIREEFK